MSNIQYINSNFSLQNLILLLEKSSKIAVDLEFDSNHHHYGFNLCLMQIYCNNQAYLVDPQSVDIRLIFPIFENDKIEKVVFAFNEDLRLLNSLGCKPKKIYDISIAIKLLNYEKISLADALELSLNIKLEKESQMSDWCRRPFSEKQKIYAANDVFYLFELQKVVEKQALEKEILEWISEENKALEKVNNIENAVNIIKKKDRYKMTEYQWFLYQKLWNLREKIAKELDKPAYQVINNEFLKELVSNLDLLKNWKSNKQIHHSIKTDLFQGELLQILEEVNKEAKKQNISKINLEIKPTPKEEMIKMKAHKKILDQLKEKTFKPIQNCIRRDYGEFAYTYILSNKIIEDIVCKEPILNYKRNLILKYAQELGVEVKKYL